MNYQQISLNLLAAICTITTLNLEDKFVARTILAAALREAGFGFPEEAAAEVVPLCEPLNLSAMQSVAYVIAKGSADMSVRFGALILKKIDEI